MSLAWADPEPDSRRSYKYCLQNETGYAVYRSVRWAHLSLLRYMALHCLTLRYIYISSAEIEIIARFPGVDL